MTDIEEKPKRARVRSGCMRCRTKRRKCDEAKPVCGRCKEKEETCQWGTRIVFREENNRSLDTPQLSLTEKKSKRPAPGHFEIQDVTAEVIRDHQQQDFSEPPLERSMSTSSTLLSRTVNGGDVQFDAANAWKVSAPMDMMPLVDLNSAQDGGTYHDPSHDSIDNVSSGLPLVEDLSYIWPSPTANGLYDDSIFLPGSAYLDAHSTLRSHLYHEANASAATREGTPELRLDDKFEATLPSGASSGYTTPRQTAVTEEEEFSLLQNWVEEGKCCSRWLRAFTDVCLKSPRGWTNSTIIAYFNTHFQSWHALTPTCGIQFSPLLLDS
ncbi:hypothetical protein E8E11_008084 [Didymella keratinophila]|nr:hypothetical protein E8E11_008084 [Didymella keratinophila]